MSSTSTADTLDDALRLRVRARRKDARQAPEPDDELGVALAARFRQTRSIPIPTPTTTPPAALDDPMNPDFYGSADVGGSGFNPGAQAPVEAVPYRAPLTARDIDAVWRPAPDDARGVLGNLGAGFVQGSTRMLPAGLGRLVGRDEEFTRWREDARYDRPAEGVAGFVGETVGGMVSGFVNPAELPANVLGAVTGAGAVAKLAPVLERVAVRAGPRAANALRGMIEGGTDAGSISMLQQAGQITPREWSEDPSGALLRVLAAGGVGAAVGGGVGGAAGAASRVSPGEAVEADLKRTRIGNMRAARAGGVAREAGDGAPGVPALTNEGTVPETDATIAAQIERIGVGQRLGVLIPAGQDPPAAIPDGLAMVQTRRGAVIIDPDLIEPEQVVAAEGADELGRILGYGVDRKPEQPTAVVVTRDARGSEVSAVVVDDQTRAAAHRAAAENAVPGDVVTVEDPGRVLAERLEQLQANPGEIIARDPDVVRGPGRDVGAGAPRRAVFTTAGIEAQILDRYDASPEREAAGVEMDMARDQSFSDGSGMFSFAGALPAEVSDIIDGRPELRMHFRSHVKGGKGADYLAELGADRYVELAIGEGGKRLDRAMDWARSAQDPESRFLAAVRDNLPAAHEGRPTGKVAMTPETLKRGSSFTIDGERVRVEESEGGFLVLRDGDVLPETPLDAMAAVPIDKGSLRLAGGKDSIRDRALGVAARLERSAARNLDAVKGRAVPRGRNVGAIIILDDIVDHAIAVAKFAAAKGIRGSVALSNIVNRVVSERGTIKVPDDVKEVRRLAAMILRRGVLPDGRSDMARIEGAAAELRASRDPGRIAARREARARAEATLAERQAADHGATLTDEEKAAGGLVGLGAEVDRIDDATARRDVHAARTRADAMLSTLSGPSFQRGQAVGRIQARAAAELAVESKRALEALKIEAQAFSKMNLPEQVRDDVATGLLRAQSPEQVGRVLRKFARALAKRDAVTHAEGLAALSAPSKLARLSLEDRAKLRDIVRRADLTQTATAVDLLNNTELRERADALRALYADAWSLHHAQSTARELFALNMAKNAGELVDKLVAAISTRPAIPGGKGLVKTETSGLVRLERRSYNMDTLAQMMDGDFDRRGPVSILVAALERAEEARLQRRFKLWDQADAIVRRHGYAGLADFQARTAATLGHNRLETLPLTLGELRNPPKGLVMALAAMDDTTVGLVVAQSNPLSLSTDPTAATFRVDAGTMERARGLLSDDDRAIVAKMKDLMSTQFPEAHAVALALTGTAPDLVGGYFPRRRNGQLRAGQGVPPAVKLVQRHLENAGYMRDREGGSDPILLQDFGFVVLEHLDSMAALIEQAKVIRDAEMVLFAPRVKQAITTRLGAQAVRDLETVIGDYAGARKPGESMVDRAAVAINRNAARSWTQLNKNTWLRQLGGSFRLLAEMDVRDWSAGMAAAGQRGLAADLLQRSGWFRKRWGTAAYHQFTLVDDAVANTIDSSFAVALKNFGAEAGRRATLKSADVWTAWTALLDSMKIGNVFDAVPARVAYAGFLSRAQRDYPGWTAHERAEWAAARAVSAFRRTQNTSGSLDSSVRSVEGRTGGLGAMWQTFQSDASKQFNMIRQAVLSGDRKRIVKTLSGSALSVLWSMVVTRLGVPALGLVAATVGGEDTTTQHEYAGGAALMSGLRDMESAVLPTGGRVTTLLDAAMRRGRGVGMTPLASVAEDASAGLYTMGNQLRLDRPGQDAKFWKGALRLVKAVGAAAGAPVPVVNEIERLLKVYYGNK